MSTEPPAQPRFPGAGTKAPVGVPDLVQPASVHSARTSRGPPVPGPKGAGPPPQRAPPTADPSKGPCRPTVPCTLPWSMLNPQGLLKYPARPMEAPRLPLHPCQAFLPLRPGSPAEQVGKLSVKCQGASGCASAGLTSVTAAAAPEESQRK